MFRRKTTITRPDRDRLIKVTRAKANRLRWAMFIDELRRELDGACCGTKPHLTTRRDDGLDSAFPGPAKRSAQRTTRWSTRRKPI